MPFFKPPIMDQASSDTRPLKIFITLGDFLGIDGPQTLAAYRSRHQDQARARTARSMAQILEFADNKLPMDDPTQKCVQDLDISLKLLEQTYPDVHENLDNTSEGPVVRTRIDSEATEASNSLPAETSHASEGNALLTQFLLLLGRSPTDIVSSSIRELRILVKDMNQKIAGTELINSRNWDMGENLDHHTKGSLFRVLQRKHEPVPCLTDVASSVILAALNLAGVGMLQLFVEDIDNGTPAKPGNLFLLVFGWTITGAAFCVQQHRGDGNGRNIAYLVACWVIGSMLSVFYDLDFVHAALTFLPGWMWATVVLRAVGRATANYCGKLASDPVSSGYSDDIEKIAVGNDAGVARASKFSMFEKPYVAAVCGGPYNPYISTLPAPNDVHVGT